jgi:hypothetical protein
MAYARCWTFHVAFDSESPRRPEMSPGAVLIALASAMFPALILVALAVKLREINEAGRWPETTGKVIASRVQSRHNKPDDPGYNFGDTEVSDDPFVEYEYKVGDRSYR